MLNEETDEARLARLRNKFSYGNYKNKVIEYTLSDKWETIPGRMNVRGECIQKFLKGGQAIVKIVANGCVSGEFVARTCHCHSTIDTEAKSA